MSEYDIPIGSVVIDLNGKNIATFANHIPRRKDAGAFTVAGHDLWPVYRTDGFQVWRGDVDERGLAQYPQWFNVAHGDVYRKQHG